MTAQTQDTPAFAACEALFDANPAAIADEGDAGQVMPVILFDRHDLRLVRHDTVAGRFYRVYPPDDLAILTISRDIGVSEAITQDLREAIPAPA
jgi:hypothetical protein